MQKLLTITTILLFFVSCNQKERDSEIWLTKEDLQLRVNQFHNYTISPDLSTLSESERKMIPHLKKAMDAVDQIFWNQISADGPELKARLEKQTDSLSQLALQLVKINYGPYDVDDNKNRIAGFGFVSHPGYNLYPAGFNMNKLRSLIDLNPEMDEKLRAFNTVVIENEEKISAVSYERYFAHHLKTAKTELLKAAEISDNPSYKTYLTNLAEGLLNADYRKADSSWVSVTNAKLEFVTGPLESYYDEFLQTKTFYEGLLGVVDSDLNQKLTSIQKTLPQLNKSLPNAANWLPDIQTLPNATPINVIYLSGGLNFSYKTISAHLPERGPNYGSNPFSKNLILTNVMEAKFESILKPISAELLDSSAMSFLSARHLIIFNSLYESAQPAEPETVTGKSGISPRIVLGEYSNITRVLKNQLYAMYYAEKLTEGGILTTDDLEKLSISHLAGLFRVMRFGGEDSEVIGNLILFNLLADAGIINYNNTTLKWTLNIKPLKSFTTVWVKEITDILTNGNVQRIKSLKEKYGVRKPELNQAFTKIKHIPVDVNLIFN